MNRKNIFLLLVCCMVTTPCLFAQSVFGTWKTIDDRTGQTKAVVDIFRKDGLMYGRVIEILEEGKEDAKCIKCDGDRKNRPIEGMTIIDGLEHDGEGYWEGDELLDPEHGKIYRCKIWLDPDNPDNLKVRGYLAFFYRTQTWKRVEG